MNSASRTRPLTVLVVDEDPRTRTSICHIVGEEYPVLMAFDSYHALHIAHASHPDMIVMGVPPRPTPTETEGLHILLNDQGLSRTPILLLGSGGRRDREWLLALSSNRSFKRHGVVALRDRHDSFEHLPEELHRLIGTGPGPCTTAPHEQPHTTNGHAATRCAWTDQGEVYMTPGVNPVFAKAG